MAQKSEMDDLLSSLSPSERDLYELLGNPADWGETMLVNRDGQPRRYREYQREDLECSADRIVHMDGRAVGKTVDLSTMILWFALRNTGKSVLIAAPFQGQLDTIIDEIEYQIGANDILRESVARNSQGQPKIKRKPYFEMEFTNGVRLYFRPAGSAGGSFRSLHVDFLVVDEAAWLPEPAWNALRQCLNAGGQFRVYSTPNGLRDTTYYRITQSKEWRQFRWPSWVSPDWTEERKADLLEFYGGNDTPGWQHEVAGEHGKPTYGAFSTVQVMRSLSHVQGYRKITIRGSDLDTCKDEQAIRERLEILLNLSGGQGIYWLGGDLGYTSDPTELLLLEEDQETKRLRLILRIHAEHIAYPVITEVIALVDRLYVPHGIGVDRGGNGMSVVQELLGLDKYRNLNLSGRLVGYDFGGTIEVGEDERGRAVKVRIKEHMTALINEALNGRVLELPKQDSQVEDQLCTQTYVLSERGVVYSKGNDHVVDALRCAMIRRAQEIDPRYDRTETTPDVFPARLTRPLP